MKKYLIVILLIASILLCGCGEEPVPEVEVYTVTFDTKGGSSIEPQKVERGDRIQKPSDPTKDCLCIFDGWYYGDEEWSFIGYVVTEDMTLTAKWLDCFGLNEKEYEILSGFVDSWGRTWKEIVGIVRGECADEWFVENGYIEYTITFCDGAIKKGRIKKKDVGLSENVAQPNPDSAPEPEPKPVEKVNVTNSLSEVKRAYLNDYLENIFECDFSKRKVTEIVYCGPCNNARLHFADTGKTYKFDESYGVYEVTAYDKKWDYYHKYTVYIPENEDDCVFPEEWRD